jgi:hypothetical protein
MIKDSTKELMEDFGPVPQDSDNEWLKQLTGGPKPKPALTGRLLTPKYSTVISSRQRRGVKYGK